MTLLLLFADICGCFFGDVFAVALVDVLGDDFWRDVLTISWVTSFRDVFGDVF